MRFTKQQEIQNAQIARGTGIRYILGHLKSEGTADYFTEGPFPAHGGTWATDAPSPGHQRLLAALREYDRDGHPMHIVVGAYVADGKGGIKYVTGGEVPDVRCSLTQQVIRVKNRKGEGWDAAHDEYLEDLEKAKRTGGLNMNHDLQRLKAEKAEKALAPSASTVAVGEPIAPVPAPALEDAGDLPKAKAKKATEN